jgi:uncharacterized protein (DUF2384 family)
MTLFNTVAPRDGLGLWHQGAMDLERLRAVTGFNNHDLAQIASVPKSSVRTDDKAPREVREHLENIANICNLVFGFFDDSVKTKLWLQTPNPMLGNISPRDMIRFGRFAKLQRFVMEAVAEGHAVGQGQQKKES